MRARLPLLAVVVASLSLASEAVAEPLPSCESVIASNVDDASAKGPKDLSAADFGRVLDEGSYLGPCEVPTDMAVEVCAAVKEGKAVGVTVTTKPSDRAVADCVAAQVASLEFPSHPKLDVARTTFAPAPKDEPGPKLPEPTQAAAPAPVAPKQGGCGCALPGTEAAGGAGSALALAVSLFVRRRRRAR